MPGDLLELRVCSRPSGRFAARLTQQGSTPRGRRPSYMRSCLWRWDLLNNTFDFILCLGHSQVRWAKRKHQVGGGAGGKNSWRWCRGWRNGGREVVLMFRRSNQPYLLIYFATKKIVIDFDWCSIDTVNFCRCHSFHIERKYYNPLTLFLKNNRNCRGLAGCFLEGS